MAPKEAYRKAKAAAIRAIELDGTLGEAHISLAYCLDGFDWDFDSAGREFNRGIELSPSYATGYEWYGWHLASLGRNGKAVAQVEKAENLDPLSLSLSLIISSDLAEELLVAHRYDEAEKQTQQTINMDHFFAPAHYVMGEAFVQKHRYDEAIAELRKSDGVIGRQYGIQCQPCLRLRSVWQEKRSAEDVERSKESIAAWLLKCSRGCPGLRGAGPEG